MKILWLLPDLGFTSAARQASLVVPELTRGGAQCRIAVLRSGGPFTALLKSANVDVVELATRHDLGLRYLWALNRLLRDWQPDVIHAWRWPTIRALGMARTFRGHRSGIIASQLDRGHRPSQWDRWLLKKLIGDRQQPEVPLAVVAPSKAPEREPQKIVCMGRFDKAHGFFEGVWGHDVLSHFMPHLKIDFIGNGPELHRVESFVRSISHHAENIRFFPPSIDAIDRLGEAAMAWIPSISAAGEQVALEAQAAGTPVIATRIPSLSAIIADGATGLLAPVSDPVAMAKAARQLLENPEELRRLGEAGRERVLRDHAPGIIAAKWLGIYQSLAATR